MRCGRFMLVGVADATSLFKDGGLGIACGLTVRSLAMCCRIYEAVETLFLIMR